MSLYLFTLSGIQVATVYHLNDTRHSDTQHNDTQHNDTQHNDTQYNDAQHNDTLSITIKTRYLSYCHAA